MRSRMSGCAGGPFRLIGLVHELEELGADLGSQADIREQVGRDRQVARGREAVRDARDLIDETPDLVDDDDPAFGRPVRLGSVGADSFDIHHRHDGRITPASGFGIRSIAA